MSDVTLLVRVRQPENELTSSNGQRHHRTVAPQPVSRQVKEIPTRTEKESGSVCNPPTGGKSVADAYLVREHGALLAAIVQEPKEHLSREPNFEPNSGSEEKGTKKEGEQGRASLSL